MIYQLLMLTVVLPVVTSLLTIAVYFAYCRLPKKPAPRVRLALSRNGK
jgi:hypothetical protein